MRSTLVDTGPLVALIDRRDRHHDQAVGWLQRAHRPLVTNIAVLTEATHLLDHDSDAHLRALELVARVMEVDRSTADDLPRIAAVLRKYKDQSPDFADASLVALAERLGTDRVATIDRDFDQFRLTNGKPLRNVFYAAGGRSGVR